VSSDEPEDRKAEVGESQTEASIGEADHEGGQSPLDGRAEGDGESTEGSGSPDTPDIYAVWALLAALQANSPYYELKIRRYKAIAGDYYHVFCVEDITKEISICHGARKPTLREAAETVIPYVGRRTHGNFRAKST
jgi:hypothetical protein